MSEKEGNGRASAGVCVHGCPCGLSRVRVSSVSKKVLPGYLMHSSDWLLFVIRPSAAAFRYAGMPHSAAGPE